MMRKKRPLNPRQMLFDFMYEEKKSSLEFLSERDLFLKAQTHNQEAIEYLIRKHKGLVFHIGRKRFYAVSDAKLQDGLIGLWQAILRFDVDRGIKFSTFASTYIWGYMMRSGRRTMNIFKLDQKMMLFSEISKDDETIEFAKDLRRHSQDVSLRDDIEEMIAKLKRPERDKQIVRERLSGKTLQNLGDMFGLSRERCRLIVKTVTEDIAQLYKKESRP